MNINKSKRTPLVYNKDYQCIYITVNRASAFEEYIEYELFTFTLLVTKLSRFSIDLFPIYKHLLQGYQYHPYNNTTKLI